jgi:hypothetical protein
MAKMASYRLRCDVVDGVRQSRSSLGFGLEQRSDSVDNL